MQITLHKLTENISTTAIHSTGMHAVGRVHGLVVRFYCNKLSARSACPGTCDTCIIRVRNHMDRIEWSTSFRPYGLFTQMLKNASAEAVEAAAAADKGDAKQDAGSALDILLEAFDGR
jgi:hypothetical protein